MTAFRTEPDGSVHELDADGEVVAISVPDDVWDQWECERLERAAQARAPRQPRPSRLEVLENENAELRAEVHRLRDLADCFAVMLSAQAEPCPCVAVPPALEVAA